MSITLSAPPAVVQEVRCYAQRNNTSLNEIIREHLESIAAGERKRREHKAKGVYEYLMRQRGWLPKGYEFNREEANEG